MNFTFYNLALAVNGMKFTYKAEKRLDVIQSGVSLISSRSDLVWY